MIDYFETRSQPITKAMVYKAYGEVRANKGSGGIDGMNWDDLEKDLSRQMHKLWVRLSSGSYFPTAVKQVEIAKKDGGVRKLGIPTLLDRIAQQVVKTYLEPMVEPRFHESSFGYRPGRSCHQAVQKATNSIFNHDWVIDLDIKSFFDTIDHELMMKALRFYCQDNWVLLYVFRWLKAGILQKDGSFVDRISGTPQGGVISPLLANIYLDIVFDRWMQKNHPEKPFERYADDIVVHCKTDKQARFVLACICERLRQCSLEVHPQKTRIVNLRGWSEQKYPRSFDFLGFTFKPIQANTAKGRKLMITTFISKKSLRSISDKFRNMQLHKRRISLEALSKLLNPITRGVGNYYCKVWSNHTRVIWNQLNRRLWKWVKWEKGLYAYSALYWLRRKYKEKPNLFYHWKYVHP